MAKLIRLDGCNNKAVQITDSDGSITLYSYDTPVARIDNDHHLHKLWNGWSATTWRHIRAFCDYNGITTPTAKEWKDK